MSGKFSRKEGFQLIGWGVLWIGVTALLIWHAVKPLDSYRLIVHGQTASGHVIKADQEQDKADNGTYHCDHWLTCVYSLPDGSEVTTTVHGRGYIPDEFDD